MIRRCLIAAGLLATLASPAAAATLATSDVYVPAMGDLHCTISNVSALPYVANVSLFDNGGNTIKAAGFSLAPGKSVSIVDSTSSAYYGRCQFDVNGPKSAFRAASNLYAISNGIPVVIPAR
jgi:hypothetical protein